MLTKNEITALNLSPTKKDFVQIWNELLEVAGRLSERWDPTSTNESDPGIVILKALTGIADKLNYNIDKNTLEAFMPTAAQEDSMRKLCDMLGYNVKYYRSAETAVTFKYHNPESADNDSELLSSLFIPKFTVITNGDQDINYFTTNQTPRSIASMLTSGEALPCMEGQIVKCESTTDNNVITASQISDNNRYYLPEHRIAENGIFVYNVAANQEDGDGWLKVDNLNIQARGLRVFKFGYDSYEGRPYIEFPEDWSSLINNGLFIYYARTSGTNGNISARVLTQFEPPSGEGWDEVSIENFSIENTFAATTGADIETINQAYNNFKKTIGTFETLVTCRDYMNKIYNMTDDYSGKALVSNALVTDIRNDLNRAIVICSCDDAGIFYKETALTKPVTKKLKGKYAGSLVDVEVEEHEPLINHFDLVLYPFKSYSQIRNNVKDIQDAYDASFKYNHSSFTGIKNNLNDSELSTKTITHNIIAPRAQDVVSINNYLKLNAIISTTSKITNEEGSLLIEKIKIALANAFNLRELDFGEEIPFESILNVIKNTDTKIGAVSLAEPALYTTFSVLERFDNLGNPVLKEYAVASDWLSEEYANSSDRFEYDDDNTYTFDTKRAREIYNYLAVRNILAGRVPLFKYNTTFQTNFSEAPYRITDTDIAAEDIPAPIADLLRPSEDSANPENGSNRFKSCIYDGVTYTGQLVDNNIIYTATYVPDIYINNVVTKNANDDDNFTNITTSCKITAEAPEDGSPQQLSDVTLANGEFIKFRAPNFTTQKTFPAYVNYHLSLASDTFADAKLATAYTLYDLLNTQTGKGTSLDARRAEVLNYFSGKTKTFNLVQKISRKVDTVGDSNTLKNDSFYIENPVATEVTDTPASILLKSGFVRLCDRHATLAWSPATDEQAPAGSVGPNLSIPSLTLGSSDSNFIISSSVFTSIQNEIDNWLTTNFSDLPTDCSWTISYTFEYVPFEASTLSMWEDFIRTCDENLFGFKPASDQNVVLWRKFTGSYSPGKYILPDVSKLLPFSAAYFDALAENRLTAIWVAEDLGSDLKPNFISNNEEYMLKQGECLYIEYTPSSTTEDGTTQEQESVQEVLKAGTIIRPYGFTNGLIDSSKQQELGNSATKTIDFKEKASVPMYSLGASEQIEIRDLARVVLDKSTLPDASAIYIYKNFNDCKELETTSTVDTVGKRTYTLKDGEYIFYTDQNKAEFAYFASGTEVTLEGNLVLPHCEIIDLSIIFDSGIHEIPWKRCTFIGEDSITFQEFQYVTLGAGDKLNKLRLNPSTTSDNYYLDEKRWQKCWEVSYTPAGAENPISLPKISLSNASVADIGWEACSILELSTSPTKAQTLRRAKTGNAVIETSITLNKGSDIDVDNQSICIAGALDAPISVRANLACQSSSSKIDISDIYLNPNKVKSFELKVFAEQPPAVVKTQKGSLNPVFDGTRPIDITNWPDNNSVDTTSLTTKIYGGLWSRVELAKFGPSSDDTEASNDYENALKLPICLLPNTYGIFSIYLDYAGSTSKVDTWIELLPDRAANLDLQKYITLLNVAPAEVEIEKTENDTIKLKLNQGINCIRINKTCDIFVKTNSSDGNLLFDDLRLVDCKPIEYLEDGKVITQQTQGINLSQIGYLDTSSTDSFNVFDMQIREKLKEEYTKDALDQLTAKEYAGLAERKVLVEAVKQYEPKLTAVAKFLTDACNEIQHLKTLDYNTLSSLFIKYKELYEDLSTETDLLEALNDNSEIDVLEQQLVSLLSDLDTNETIKHGLFENLDELEQTIKDSFDASKLSKGDILDDFEVAASSSNSQLINDLKLVSLKEINKDYTAKLDNLKIAAEAVVDEEAKASLLSILEDLNVTTHKKLLSQVQILLESNQSTLDASLTEAQTIAAGNGSNEVDYPALYTMLVNLRKELGTISIDEILAKIELVTNSNMVNIDKYHELAVLISELDQLLAVEANAVFSNYATVITTINSLLTSIQTKISTSNTAVDTAILETLSSIYTESSKVYIERIVNTLKDMQDILATLEANYSEKVASLQASENSAVQAILSNLESYSTTKTELVNTVSSFGEAESFNLGNDYLYLPSGVIAVLTVWPIYIQRDFISGVDKLYKDVRKAINEPGIFTSLSIDTTLYTATDATKLRQLLADAINIEAFEQLFIQANNQASVNKQNLSRTEFINQLGELSTEASLLNEALQGVLTDNDDKLAVVRKIAADLQANPAVIEKQLLVSNLKQALADVIKIDTQLLTICAKLLCPSILLFDTILPTVTGDVAFCTRLMDYLEELLTADNDGILSLISPQDEFIFDVLTKFDYIYTDLYYAQLVTNTLSDALTDGNDISSFNYWDAVQSTGEFEGTNGVKTLLPENFLEQLSQIKVLLDKQVQITAIKASKLLSILQDSSLVIAWQDVDYNWRDSSGNYFKRYSGGQWLSANDWRVTNGSGAVWTDAEGFWRTADDLAVKVDLKHEYLYTDEESKAIGIWKDSVDNEVAVVDDNNLWLHSDDSKAAVEDLDGVLTTLNSKVQDLGELTVVSKEAKAAYRLWCLENQLLSDIRAIDINHEFYYNVPIESHMAINFNESDTKLNTLMNPAVNYDINNINNNFVISKLDINYITSGFQLARSSIVK